MLTIKGYTKVCKVLKHAKINALSCVRPLSVTRPYQYEKRPTNPPHLTHSYCHGVGDIPLLGVTLPEMLQATVEKNPDRECVVFVEDGIRLTLAEIMKQVDQLAAGLHRLGFKKGDRVGVWGPNTLEWVLTQLATSRIGVILVNVNPAYQTRELEFAMNKVQIKGIISAATFKTQNYYKMLAELSPELATCAPLDLRSKRIPSLTSVIMMGSEKFPGAMTFEDLMQAGTTGDIAEVQNISRSLNFDDPINIQFTSGTTGNPKGATLSHHNIINNLRYIGERLGYGDYHHRALVQVPLYHAFGMVGGPVSLAVYGTGLVFPSTGYEPAESLKCLQEERINVIYGTPTMYIDMTTHPDVGKYNYDTVQKGLIGGSPCPPEVVQKVEKIFRMKLTVLYGTTENSPVTFMNYLDDADELRQRTVGRVMPHTEVKVVDENGKILPINSVGDLWTRGYCVMVGYWGDEDKTAESITKEGWYKTGDLGSIDSQGYGRITGRTKDMVIRGGENIYPTEIEDVVHTMEKVDNVEVFGVPDERMGEEVAAWISIKDGESATEDEVRAFCKERMAHFKIPRYIKFVTEFPLTVTRKVQKFKMREEFSRELGLK